MDLSGSRSAFENIKRRHISVTTYVFFIHINTDLEQTKSQRRKMLLFVRKVMP